MKIPDAKAAVDKELKMLETIQAWDVRKIKKEKEVIKNAEKNVSTIIGLWTRIEDYQILGEDSQRITPLK